MKKLLFTLNFIACLMIIHPKASQANAIFVSGLAVNQAGGTVSFNLTWNNSWWNGNNWDAAWVFVKFRDCNNASQEFNHGLISTTMGNHTLGGFQATNASGTPDIIDAAPDNTGIMLRRNTPGMGSINSTVTLRVSNLPSSGNYDVRVYAIEMVFVPQGSFIAGDGNGTGYSPWAFGGINAVVIPSENAITLEGSLLLAGFPKGVNAFYIMKYEISQGQYADFLNGCGSGQAANRYPSFFSLNRNQLVNTGAYPQNHLSSRPDRAMNYLNWSDLAGYLDWAALRPMTELQYEKACRGGAPAVVGECAWGSTASTAATQISGPENGTEVILAPANANCAISTVNYTGGDGGTGPVRCGIFATAATTTRLQTGATYWGVMEMSGNVMEHCISIYAGASGQPSANGVLLGDGMLDALGQHNVASWPPNAIGSVIYRGGGYSSSGCNTLTQSSSVSCRANTNFQNYRLSYTGGRGIR